MKTNQHDSTVLTGGAGLTIVLLACGILSTLYYIAVITAAAYSWPEYSSISMTVSELIGIDAPSQSMAVPLLVVYSLLVYAFGAGIWRAAGSRRALRIAAVGIAGKEVFGLIVTLFFPIHLRGIAETFTDTMHGILTGVGVLSFLIAIGFAATVFGKWFRYYSIATILVLFVFAFLTYLDVPNMTANLPTPYMGVWERVNIFGYFLWLVVLAVMLLKEQKRERIFH